MSSPITVAILTVSDSAASGAREDLSGPLLRRRCEELGWTVAASEIVSDEQPMISERIARWSDENAAAVVLTTGGTGVATRDVTPEATRAVLERELPGFAELMRFKGLEQTPMASLSRAIAGTRGRCLIVNFPGSPKGAVHSLNVIAPLVAHAVQLLLGQTEHTD